MKDKLTIIAETLVNQKIMRNGSPAINNPLDILPEKLKKEVMDDAAAILEALSLT